MERHSCLKRKIFVCLEQKCRRCSIKKDDLLEDCPYGILHGLCEIDGGTQNRPRRSGKTTELIKLANKANSAGFTVYFIVNDTVMSRMDRDSDGLNNKINIYGYTNALRSLLVVTPGIIIADEITDEQMRYLRKEILDVAGHIVLAHYWTKET